VGFRRIRTTLIGGIAGLSDDARSRWLNELHTLGQEAK
jgi:hypothetical protein